MPAENTASLEPVHNAQETRTTLHDTKVGLLRLFIGLAKDGSMEPDEVLEYIQEVTENNAISPSEADGLKHELDVALGRTTEQLHDTKIGLLRLFINLAKEEKMEFDEVTEYIQQVATQGAISAEEQAQLVQELKFAVGQTPEQIRSNKIGLLEGFIGLYQTGRMEKSEVEEYIERVLEHKFISEQDATELRSKLETITIDPHAERT